MPASFSGRWKSRTWIISRALTRNLNRPEDNLENPRSTVGTVTEIYDYLRLLWARIGIVHCPNCGKMIKQQTIDQIIDKIMTLDEDTRIQILAPVVRSRKGSI